MQKIMDSAVALYDGGWRSSDRDQLISEYGFTPDQADEIAAALAEIEDENRLSSVPESVSIDTIRGNSIYTKNAVVTRETFRGDWNALMRGERVPCEWDENDSPIAWDVLSEEEEED